jgi:hypothetical protein
MNLWRLGAAEADGPSEATPQNGTQSAQKGETARRDRPYSGVMLPVARLKKPLALTAASALGLVGFLAVAKLAKEPWPLVHANLWLAGGAVVLAVLSLLIRFAGWQQLFARDGRPDAPTCVGAGSAASVSANFLPAKLDYALKVWLVHRLSGRRLSLKSGTVSVCMLGLVDAAALLPPALAGAAIAPTTQIRVPLLAVAAVGLASTVLILSAPRLQRLLPSGRLQRFSGKVAGQRTSWRDQLAAYVLLSASLWTRVSALILLLLALHIGLSLTGALAFICLTAGSAFVPIPSFSLGAGTVALSALGLGVDTAARFALAVSLVTLLAAVTLTIAVTLFYAARQLRGRRVSYA